MSIECPTNILSFKIWFIYDWYSSKGLAFLIENSTSPVI